MHGIVALHLRNAHELDDHPQPGESRRELSARPSGISTTEATQLYRAFIKYFFMLILFYTGFTLIL